MWNDQSLRVQECKTWFASWCFNHPHKQEWESPTSHARKHHISLRMQTTFLLLIDWPTSKHKGESFNYRRSSLPLPPTVFPFKITIKPQTCPQSPTLLISSEFRARTKISRTRKINKSQNTAVIHTRKGCLDK